MDRGLEDTMISSAPSLATVGECASSVGGVLMMEAEFTEEEQLFRERQAEKFGEASQYLAQMLGYSPELITEADERFGDDTAGAAEWMQNEGGATPGLGLTMETMAEQYNASEQQRVQEHRAKAASSRVAIAARLALRKRNAERAAKRAEWDAGAAKLGIAPAAAAGVAADADAAAPAAPTAAAVVVEENPYGELVFDDSALDVPPGAACARFGTYKDDDHVEERLYERELERTNALRGEADVEVEVTPPQAPTPAAEIEVVEEDDDSLD